MTKEASKKKTSKLRWAASSEPPHLSAASVLRSSGPRAGPRRFPVVRSGEGEWRARESESESESEKIEKTLGSVSNNVVDSHLFSSFSLLFFLTFFSSSKTGHNGCVACLSLIFRESSNNGQQQHRGPSSSSSSSSAPPPLCPLCRAPFSRVPAPNHELRELVDLAEALAPHRGCGGSSSDDEDEEEGDGGEGGGGGGGGGEGGGGGKGTGKGGRSKVDEWTDVARPGQIFMRRRRTKKERQGGGESDDDDDEEEEETGGKASSSSSSSPLALAAFPLPSRSSRSPSSAVVPLHRVTVGAVRAGLADPWDLDPPASWEPDSASPACACCGAAFAGLIIGGGGGGRGGGGRRGSSSDNDDDDGGGDGGDLLSASTSSTSSTSSSSSSSSTALSGLRAALAAATALASSATSAATNRGGGVSSSRRHHCRACGAPFCSNCTRWRVVLPPKFAQRGSTKRARACGACAALLQPTQARAAASLSASAQPPVSFFFSFVFFSTFKRKKTRVSNTFFLF